MKNRTETIVAAMMTAPKTRQTKVMTMLKNIKFDYINVPNHFFITFMEGIAAQTLLRQKSITFKVQVDQDEI